MRARRRSLTLAAATVLVVGLGAGCAHHDGASPKATPDAASSTVPPDAASTTAPSAGPSQLAEMRKKVNAAESAAAAADRDAAGTADR
ncbi:hypothetical protein [Streptomyces sp. NPDC001851]|uniref:hypothetical protein n=1 Tax=Streptomyces sp. NPDC001851 TaxID=3154529 RepID=UPI003319E753